MASEIIELQEIEFDTLDLEHEYEDNGYSVCCWATVTCQGLCWECFEHCC